MRPDAFDRSLQFKTRCKLGRVYQLTREEEDRSGNILSILTVCLIDNSHHGILEDKASFTVRGWSALLRGGRLWKESLEARVGTRVHALEPAFLG